MYIDRMINLIENISASKKLTEAERSKSLLKFAFVRERIIL
jgi:hypothetical protein